MAAQPSPELPHIRRLDEAVVNRIAAGEVIQVGCAAPALGTQLSATHDVWLLASCPHACLLQLGAHLVATTGLLATGQTGRACLHIDPGRPVFCGCPDVPASPPNPPPPCSAPPARSRRCWKTAWTRGPHRSCALCLPSNPVQYVSQAHGGAAWCMQLHPPIVCLLRGGQLQGGGPLLLTAAP